MSSRFNNRSLSLTNKCSTLQANKRERAKASPCYKDLDFRDEVLPQGLSLEPETYNALITTMRRDCRVLESFRIMDYSMLIGVHNLDQSAREEAVCLLVHSRFK